MLKKLSVTLCAVCALAFAACGESTTNTNNTNGGNTNSNRATSTTTTSTSGGKIGVAECDELIDKYEACVSGKVPEVARAQFKTQLEQWRNSWRAAAANAETRARLPEVCKTSIEPVRASLKGFGCDF